MGPSKLLELFNFPDPSATRGRRDRTNVPAQALGMLNHPLVHHLAKVHAAGLLETSSHPEVNFEESLESLFLLLFSRPPSDRELREYATFFQKLAATHNVTSWKAALASQATWKDLIHTLYNLKEFTYVL